MIKPNIAQNQALESLDKSLKKLQKNMSSKNWLKARFPRRLGFKSLVKLFGSWGEFLRYINIDTYEEKYMKRDAKNYKLCINKLGRNPNTAEYQNITKQRYTSMIRKYNGWKNYCETMEKLI